MFEASNDRKDAGLAMPKKSFRRAVGTMSKKQVAGFMVTTISVSEGRVMGWEQSNLDEQNSEIAKTQRSASANSIPYKSHVWD